MNTVLRLRFFAVETFARWAKPSPQRGETFAHWAKPSPRRGETFARLYCLRLPAGVSQFSILNSQFSILNSQFYIVKFS
jgi:hypothetical protein